MANQDAAFGFRAVQPTGSDSPRENVNAPPGYSIASGYASEINIGDPVASTGTADSLGRPGIELKNTPGLIAGVFAGVQYKAEDGDVKFTTKWIAGTVATEIVVFVHDDPQQIFVIQADEDIVADDIRNKADFVYAAGVNGVSRVELDSSTVGTGDALLILGIDASIEENNLGENFTKVLVKIREHELRDTLTAV